MPTDAELREAQERVNYKIPTHEEYAADLRRCLIYLDSQGIAFDQQASHIGIDKERLMQFVGTGGRDLEAKEFERAAEFMRGFVHDVASWEETGPRRW